MTGCRLCYDVLLRSPVEAWNKPVFESPNFAVLPSLGALVEGWLLLVPKKHFICMGALPDSLASEMQEMKHIISSILQRTYGQICAFEHGPSAANLSVGCGVDHAHLHIVPLAFDLASVATSFLPENLHWSEAGLKECRAAFGRGEDYLYLEQPIAAGRIATHQEFEGQLFRRAIAERIGVPNQFNWRDYPQLPKVSATIDKVREWNGGVFAWMSRPKAAA
jgi:diadenosine tetraphosphate (Ap4A) HIT family hydrolase